MPEIRVQGQIIRNKNGELKKDRRELGSKYQRIIRPHHKIFKKMNHHLKAIG